MPYQWVWVNDATDDEAEKANRLTKAEACRRSGKYPRWVDRRIQAGELRTVTWMGREYVDASSLARLIEVEGYGPTLEQRCEILKEQGRAWEAMELVERAQAEAHARMGYIPMPSSQSIPSSSELPDPLDEFIVRSSGGRRS